MPASSTACTPSSTKTEDEDDRTMLVNFKSVWLGSKFAIRQMLPQDPGRRVTGTRRQHRLDRRPGRLAAEPGYCAAKGAVVNSLPSTSPPNASTSTPYTGTWTVSSRSSRRKGSHMSSSKAEIAAAAISHGVRCLVAPVGGDE